MKEYFEYLEKTPGKYPEIQTVKTNDKEHGRIEARKYYLLANTDWMLYAVDWTNLRPVGMVHSKVRIGGEETDERRYFISSLTDVSPFSTAARSHWDVENFLYWCLGITFREDYSRIRKDCSAKNMAIVRHIALDILKLRPTKTSMARKRRRCSYDDVFLTEVLALVHA